jgi:hypothetical protein
MAELTTKITAAIVTFLLLTSCNPATEQCTTASTSAECQVGTDLGIDAGLLKIQFADSYYFDLNDNKWMTIKATELSAGIIGSTVHVYSTYLNLGLTEANNSALAAKSQKDASLNVQNQVPYIEFAAKDGVRYLYRYQKQTAAGVTLVDEQGVVPVSGTRAVLSLVNASFNNKYFTAESTEGSGFKNIVQITAETNKKAGQVYQIQFQSMFAIQSLDFIVAYSTQMDNFSLAKRWSFYENETSTGPNTNLPFFSLKEKKSTLTSVAVDARVRFKGAPKIQIKQDVFFELPFQADLFKVSGTVVPDRGYRFYVATVPADSQRDFNMKVTLGGEPLTANALVYESFGFPANRTFDIGVAYDFTPNPKYGAPPQLSGDTYSHGLLYPLKPVCHELKDQTYLPWVEEPKRDAVLAKGNYHAVCDLDDTKEVSLTAPSPDRMDTWHDFFSYAPYRPGKNELGHFYGIKSVTFSMDACLLVEVRAPGSEWIQKTVGGSNCGDSTSSAIWTSVHVERSYLIFDYVDSYKTIKDLPSVIERFKSSATEIYSTMKFNNELLSGDEIRHLY